MPINRTNLAPLFCYYYNELAGIQIVKRYGINQSGMDLVSSLDQKYYALTAISALFSKLEESKIELKSNSLNFKFQSVIS